MGASLPGRKLDVPVSFPFSVSKMSLGLEVVPSGIVKVQRQVPSIVWVAFPADSALKAKWHEVQRRTARSALRSTGNVISLNCAFIVPPLYLLATPLDAGTV